LKSDVVENNNSGSFYKFINKRLSCRQGIGALQKSCGEFITDDFGRANFFNDFFRAVCTVDNGVTQAFDNRMKDGAALDNIEFNRGTAMRAIKRLLNNTASGPDGMPPIVYKNLAQSLAEPLALIF
jgi:hypothetical protein